MTYLESDLRHKIAPVGSIATYFRTGPNRPAGFGATFDRSKAVAKVGGLGANKNRRDHTFAVSGFSIG